MYPQPSQTLPVHVCPHCHLRREACLCARVPTLDSHCHFHLLVHPRELEKPSNTGHLLLNSLAHTEWDIWSRCEPPKHLIERLENYPGRVSLLFPAEGNSDSAVSIADISSAQRSLFVLLDGTWQQAAKMYRQSSLLQRLPRLSVAAGASQFKLRRNQRSGGLSTCESAAAVLQLAGERDQAQQLMQYFEDFQRHFQASQSGHGVCDGP